MTRNTNHESRITPHESRLPLRCAPGTRVTPHASPITKRIVGIALGLLGLALVVGTVAVDWIGAGQWGGLGPAQRLALAVGAVVCLVGLSLIPLGDKPA